MLGDLQKPNQQSVKINCILGNDRRRGRKMGLYLIDDLNNVCLGKLFPNSLNLKAGVGNTEKDVASLIVRECGDGLNNRRHLLGIKILLALASFRARPPQGSTCRRSTCERRLLLFLQSLVRSFCLLCLSQDSSKDRRKVSSSSSEAAII